jgi:hypothetical protein
MTNPTTTSTNSSINIEPPVSVKTRKLWNRVMWLGIFGLFIWAYFGSEISPIKLINGSGEFWKFLIPNVPAADFSRPILLEARFTLIKF